MRKVATPEPEGFAEFWEIWLPYCRDSDGRPKAREAYKKHILDGADPQDIIDAARYHIQMRKERKSLDHIQLVASWLNCERYEFESKRWRELQAALAESKRRVASTDNVTHLQTGNTAFLREYNSRRQEG